MMVYLQGWVLLIVVWILLSGCASVLPGPIQMPPKDSSAVETGKPSSEEMKPDPRAIASLQLTEQGKMLLDNGQTDDAITVFERALSLHPNNGQNYYYLAEAWLAKGDILQAGEWNCLAETYLRDNPYWMKQVRGQKARIRKSMK
jgi:tetratricopeptide (TPR) repeat protein